MQLRQIIKGYFGGDDRDERVRAKLVETLYTHPISLLIGALCGVAACGTAAIVSGDPLITVGAVLLTAVAVARITLAYWIAYHPRARDARALERLYEAGAFSYALLSGIITARAICGSMPPRLPYWRRSGSTRSPGTAGARCAAIRKPRATRVCLPVAAMTSARSTPR